MPRCRIGRLLCALVIGASFPPLFTSAEIVLGEPPRAPTDLTGLPGGGIRPQGANGDFTVNTDSREEVRSFYNAVYRSSDGVLMHTTANVAACFPGTNSTALKEAVQRRINWYRAMAGVPANVTFDAGNNVMNQDAAVMMSANTNLSHTPPASWFCWTASGSNAANRSNIALGTSGPDSVTGYMRDHGANNTYVGHRRWLLYPQTQVMGTGDVPAAGNFLAANSIWVFDANLHEPRPPTRTPFVAWPPAGFAPYQTVYPRWSFSLSGANLSAATVTMRSNGVNVAVAIAAYQTGVGENSVVWVPMGLNANSQNTVFPFNGTDTTYTVAISNIVGAAQNFYVYTVTVFDPASPGMDYTPPVISGPTQPAVGQGNLYTFTGLSYASGYEWRASRASNFNFFDGAEANLNNFTTNTSPGYAVRDSTYRATGSFSFRLAHPAPAVEQTLTLKQSFVPKTNGALNLKTRLGYAADGETAHIQISTDDGVGWQDIFTQSGVGNGVSAPIEAAFVNRSFPLSAFAGQNVRLRFSYTYTPGFYYVYPQSGLPIGWYLDDITITNAEVWTVVASNTTPTTSFTFTPTQTTHYNLNVRGILYDVYPLDWGPTMTVTATTNLPMVLTMNAPVVAGGQVQLPFTLVSGAPASFKLLQADQPGGPWSTNASATLTTNVPGSAYRFTTAVGPAARFYRVKSP